MIWYDRSSSFKEVADLDITIETNYGKVRGFQENGIIHFRGIPYAAPPVGALRFKPPVPPKPWGDVKDCTAYGNICWQNTSPLSRKVVGDSEVFSEDCLYLNVSIPANHPENCPVLFWVHGGAFQVGSGRIGFNPALYTKQSIISVCANYRLGMLGFLQLDHHLGAEYQESGNCGMLDLIAALTWVKENIRNFGGDPNNLVVIGQSAGAKLISSILLTDKGRALINKVILESGATQCIRDLDTARNTADRYLHTAGLDSGHVQDILTWPAEKIIQAQKELFQGVNLHTVGPVFDQINLRGEAALDMIANGPSWNLPILCGTNRDEESLFYHNATKLQRLTLQNAETLFGDLAPAMMQSYEMRCNHETESEVVPWFSDVLYRNGVIQFANAISRVDQADIYVYRFDWDELTIGAAHGVECVFVWEDPAKFTGSCDLPGYSSLLQTIVSAWTAFIKTGSPQTQQLPQWPALRIDAPRMMLLDHECRVDDIPAVLPELSGIHQLYRINRT